MGGWVGLFLGRGGVGWGIGTRRRFWCTGVALQPFSWMTLSNVVGLKAFVWSSSCQPEPLFYNPRPYDTFITYMSNPHLNNV